MKPVVLVLIVVYLVLTVAGALVGRMIVGRRRAARRSIHPVLPSEKLADSLNQIVDHPASPPVATGMVMFSTTGQFTGYAVPMSLTAGGENQDHEPANGGTEMSDPREPSENPVAARTPLKPRGSKSGRPGLVRSFLVAAMIFALLALLLVLLSSGGTGGLTFRGDGKDVPTYGRQSPHDRAGRSNDKPSGAEVHPPVYQAVTAAATFHDLDRATPAPAAPSVPATQTAQPSPSTMPAPTTQPGTAAPRKAGGRGGRRGIAPMVVDWAVEPAAFPAALADFLRRSGSSLVSYDKHTGLIQTRWVLDDPSHPKAEAWTEDQPGMATNIDSALLKLQLPPSDQAAVVYGQYALERMQRAMNDIIAAEPGGADGIQSWHGTWSRDKGTDSWTFTIDGVEKTK